jgi:hypothetical protein
VTCGPFFTRGGRHPGAIPVDEQPLQPEVQDIRAPPEGEPPAVTEGGAVAAAVAEPVPHAVAEGDFAGESEAAPGGLPEAGDEAVAEGRGVVEGGDVGDGGAEGESVAVGGALGEESRPVIAAFVPAMVGVLTREGGEGEKEKHFFDKTSYITKYEAARQSYLDEFVDCRKDQLTIDASPDYISTSAVPERIAQSYSPDVLSRKRFILILRDPISRHYSEYQMRLRVCESQFRGDREGKKPKRDDDEVIPL